MTDEAVQKLLDGFVAAVPSVVPVVAVWVHGSLALGDFVPGRSDLDIVCVTDGVVPDPAALEQFHQRLLRSSPHGPKLHCTYMPVDALGEPALRHPTFAQRRYFDRPVTPVTRRELWLGNQALLGPSPQSLLPATTDEELAAFIRRDLEEFWYPVTAKRRPWYRDIWVDLALITYARATRTLQDGALITKREALALLPTLEAPDQVVADIHHRRYGSTQPTGVDTTHLRTPNHTAAPNRESTPAPDAHATSRPDGYSTPHLDRDRISSPGVAGTDAPNAAADLGNDGASRRDGYGIPRPDRISRPDGDGNPRSDRDGPSRPHAGSISQHAAVRRLAALSPARRARRGHLTRTFLRDAIPRLLASGSDDPRRLS